MKHAGGGLEQSYNVRTAVDANPQIIAAAKLSNNAADSSRQGSTYWQPYKPA
jgi:hypothetical protein